MNSRAQNFALIGYIIAALLCIVTFFLPIYRSDFPADYTTQEVAHIMEDAGLGNINENGQLGVTAHAYSSIGNWISPILCAIGVFMVLCKYRRIPIFIFGLIGGGQMIYLFISSMLVQDIMQSDLFASQYGNMTFTYQIGYYLLPVAGALMIIASLMTFVLIKER